MVKIRFTLTAMLFAALMVLTSIAPPPPLPVECSCRINSVDINKDFQFGLTGYFSRNTSIDGKCDIQSTVWSAFDDNGNAVSGISQFGGFAKITFPSSGQYTVCVTHSLVLDGTTVPCLVETYCETFNI